MAHATLLVVDDEPVVRTSLRSGLEERGYEIVEASNAEEAWQQFQQGVDLVLLDYRLPDDGGAEVLHRLASSDAGVAVIMHAADAGAPSSQGPGPPTTERPSQPPTDLDGIAALVDRTLRATQARRQAPQSDPRGPVGVERIIGQSPAMRQVRTVLAQFARSPHSTVLLTGESGTGKDLAARVLHQISARSEGPFLNVTCSAMTAPLLESELFGHERGAFTDARERKLGLLEHANGGTVFLDEIAEMSPAMQAKLLRFLEDKTFRRVGGTTDIRADVRVVAATNVPLHDPARRGAFREDLYYRLAVLSLEMPPLRERPGDIEPLLQHFIDRFNREFGKRVVGVEPATLAALGRYPWPGNIRELRNALERAVVLSERTTLTKADFLMLASRTAEPNSGSFRLPPAGIDFAALERSLVKQALRRANGNRTMAGSLLGMNRDQIRYRIEKFGLAQDVHTEIVSIELELPRGADEAPDDSTA